VLYHGPKFKPSPAYDPAALAAAINAAPMPVLIARGNADSNADQLVLNVPVQAPYVFAQVEGRRLLVAHGEGPTADELLTLAAKWKVELLFTGHLHVPTIRRVEGILHVNPGSPTYPLGEVRAPTCAVVVDGEAELITMNYE